MALNLAGFPVASRNIVSIHADPIVRTEQHTSCECLDNICWCHWRAQGLHRAAIGCLWVYKDGVDDVAVVFLDREIVAGLVRAECRRLKRVVTFLISCKGEPSYDRRETFVQVVLQIPAWRHDGCGDEAGLFNIRSNKGFLYMVRKADQLELESE